MKSKLSYRVRIRVTWPTILTSDLVMKNAKGQIGRGCRIKLHETHQLISDIETKANRLTNLKIVGIGV